jgi:hypothetical protein
MLTLSGVPEFTELLRGLGPRVLGEGVKAIRKAMGPIVKDYKRRIIVGWGYDTGAYKRSIGIIYGKVFKDRQRAVVKIGPRRGFESNVDLGKGTNLRIRKRKHDPRKTAHLVEDGHKIAQGKGGRVKARPALRPAFYGGQGQALNTVGTELGKSLMKIRAKQAARRYSA